MLGIFQMDGEIAKIAVIHADDAGPCAKHPLHFLLIMCFCQDAKAKAPRVGEKLSDLLIGEDGCDKEDGRSPCERRLFDLASVDDEVLAEHGDLHLLRHGLQVSDIAFEPFRLCQAGDRGSPRRFILFGDRRKGEVLADRPLRRRRFLELADEGEPVTCQILVKQIIRPRREVLHVFMQAAIVAVRFQPLDPPPGLGSNVV